ncbi:MAG TPA: DnaJ C-terminal domain-containing protein [Pseudomonadales bacterium]
MKFKDYYETLGLDRKANADDIKRAYRRLARKYHPDVSQEPDAEARFKEMKEAYEVLKDPEKRAAYDQFGENWEAGQDFQPPPGWDGSSFTFNQSEFGGAEHFSDFFETLFGGHGARRDPFGGGFSGYREVRMNGEDVNARLQISLADSFNGASRQISLDIPEIGPDGRPVRRRRTLNVNIPKGITAGQRIRLAGQGGPALGAGSQPGDLYLTVEFTPHPAFEAKGRDIHITLPVTPAEAVLGRSVKTPTLGGTVELRIPPGSNTGKRLRLKGRGLPGKQPGDQIVELKVVVPEHPDAATRALYEQLEKTSRDDPRQGLGI